MRFVFWIWVLLFGGLLLGSAGCVALPATASVIPTPTAANALNLAVTNALNLGAVDYDCDGEITVFDALVIMPHIGSSDFVDLWAYDLDQDGAITTCDARIVQVVIGQDLPLPIWCEAVAR